NPGRLSGSLPGSLEYVRCGRVARVSRSLVDPEVGWVRCNSLHHLHHLWSAGNLPFPAGSSHGAAQVLCYRAGRLMSALQETNRDVDVRMRSKRIPERNNTNGMHWSSINQDMLFMLFKRSNQIMRAKTVICV